MASSSSVELSELQLKSTSELCEFLRTLSIPEDVVDKFESEGICGEVLPLSLAELMELAPRIGPRRILQKRIPQLLGYLNAELDDTSAVFHEKNITSSEGSTLADQSTCTASSLQSTASTCSKESTCGNSSSAGVDSAGKSSDDAIILIERDISDTVKLSYPCELPRFSKVVHKALQTGNMPASDGLARIAYHSIGRSMFDAFPCIASAGQNAWSHFNRCLSSKIRWERQKRLKVMKRKESPKDPDAASKRPCTNSSPPPLALPSIQEPLISETVYATHIKEIQKVFTGTRKTDMTPTVMAHLDNLMQETFPRRRKLILAPDNMDTSELVEKLWKDFPCLQNDTCLMQEIRRCDIHLDTYYNDNYLGVLENLGKLYDIPHDTDFDYVQVLKETEVRLNKRIKKTEVIKVLKLNSDSMDSKVNGQTSPSLVITTDDNLVTSSHVVGFGRTLVEMQGEGALKRGLRSLMATYYILDFEYPPGYSMMLKFIQHYLMGRIVKDIPKSIKTLCSKAGVANSVD
ncbi:uncharacterized protein LOC117294042 [Asterias rubens]|uniref:uncharacterized protein LOC117294042 n=1 Tax=Asterias rubens TaxID=7604 RepID=UPI0014551486|nr:uncharacterized protein LOC117294042 [Asterias rubens]